MKESLPLKSIPYLGPFSPDPLRLSPDRSPALQKLPRQRTAQRAGGGGGSLGGAPGGGGLPSGDAESAVEELLLGV